MIQLSLVQSVALLEAKNAVLTLQLFNALYVTPLSSIPQNIEKSIGLTRRCMDVRAEGPDTRS